MREGERDDREYEEGEQLRMGNLTTCYNSIPANVVDTILFQRNDVLILSW